MPGYKTPQQFPGVSQLPELAQTLIQRLFPADELPTPGAVISPYGRMPTEALAKIRTISLDKIMEQEGPYMDRLIQDIMKNGVRNPVKVAVDSKIGGKTISNILYDGHHRVAAARKLGLPELPVKFTEGLD